MLDINTSSQQKLMFIVSGLLLLNVGQGLAEDSLDVLPGSFLANAKVSQKI